MPVLSNIEYNLLKRELDDRVNRLYKSFGSRKLKSAKEGQKARYSWARPEDMCATTGTAAELRMAVEDFKTILAEIKKLK